MGLLDGLLGQVLRGAQGGSRDGGGGLEDLLGQLGGQGRTPGGGGLGDLLGQLGGQGRAPGGGGLGDLLNQVGGSAGGMPGMGADSAASGASTRGGLGGAALGGLVMLALQMLQRNGGLQGVLGKLQQSGHAREADSWVSTGDNLPITPDVLSQVFGREEIGRAAQQMGMSPDEAAGGLASIFPEVVNEITPQGRVEPASDDVVTRALEILERNPGR